MKNEILDVYEEKGYYKNYDLLLHVPVYKRLMKTVGELTNFKKTDEVLIIGIGTGNELAYTKNKPKKIIGIDASQKMLEITRKKYENIQTINTNFLEYKPENKFDKVIAIRVLDHLEDIEKGLRIITESVKKEGEIIITIPLGANINKIWKESLKDILNLLKKGEFKKLRKGIVAGLKTGKHSKPLLPLREKNSNKQRTLISNIRKNYYITYKKRVYGEQDLLIKAVKK